MTEIVTESTQVPGATPTAGKFRARLIEGDRWGSSGYYPRDVIERDGPTVWPEGTAVYLDHPSESETFDRPERSVRDLAGKIASTPVYESDGLYADVQFYSHVAPLVEAMWEDVGLSIRASATMEAGEREGRRGQIIQSIENGVSVDVVTKAGAGGKLVALMESARESARIITETTPAPWSNRIPVAPTNTKEPLVADEQNTNVAQEAPNPFANANSGGGNSDAPTDPKDKKIADLEAQVADLKAQLKAAKSGAKESDQGATDDGQDVAEAAGEHPAIDYKLLAEAIAEHASANGAGRPSGMGHRAPVAEATRDAGITDTAAIIAALNGTN